MFRKFLFISNKLVALCVLITVMSCQQKINDVTITGQIIGDIPENINYTLPINGIDFIGFNQMVRPDSLGNFKITLAVTKASFVELSQEYKSFGTVIVEPEMHYQVLIDNTEKKPKFKVTAHNAKGQELYNKITNRNMITGHFELEANSYFKDSVPSAIETKIKQSLVTEMTEYQALLEKHDISEDFYQLVATDRGYFYAGAQGSVAFLNFLYEERNQNTLNKDQYNKLWSAVFQSYPASNPELLRSPWFYYYTQNYLRYQEFLENEVDTDSLIGLRNQGKINTYQINQAKKHLSGEQLEYYYAAFLYDVSISKNYEKELIPLFEAFKTTYSQSAYSPFIAPEIENIVAFHNKQKDSLNTNTTFINNTDSLNTLKEVVKTLNGHRYYVDVWTTWCSPCKKEFAHNSELYKLLKAKNITPLYISIDRDEKATQWKQMIAFYGLEGYQIRANKALYNNLKQLYEGNTFAIPWHILVDSDGAIIKKHVSGPSKIEKLISELN